MNFGFIRLELIILLYSANLPYGAFCEHGKQGTEVRLGLSGFFFQPWLLQIFLFLTFSWYDFFVLFLIFTGGFI